VLLPPADTAGPAVRAVPAAPGRVPAVPAWAQAAPEQALVVPAWAQAVPAA
jgi:hypothetical protein